MAEMKLAPSGQRRSLAAGALSWPFLRVVNFEQTHLGACQRFSATPPAGDDHGNS
jgi:hypothetical protein